MRRHGGYALAGALGLMLGACGSGGSGSGGARDGGAGADGGAPAADGGDDGFETLATGGWELAPGTEGYYCARKTVEEDLYISGFEAIAPPGTHHTVVTVGPPSGDDGVVPCDSFTNHDQMIFGSGVGTNPIVFPDGVAMKIEAGQQVLVNLHVFNTTDGTLSGTSGTRIMPVPESEVDEIAEAILAGPLNLSVPPGESTQTGGCIMNEDVTIFGAWPHMHLFGTHMEIVAESSVEGETVLHDRPYDFDSQILHLVEPAVPMKAGDRIEVRCTYVNPTGQTVNWGESTNDEMCFGGIYRYPASAPYFLCDDSF